MLTAASKPWSSQRGTKSASKPEDYQPNMVSLWSQNIDQQFTWSRTQDFNIPDPSLVDVVDLVFGNPWLLTKSADGN